MLESYCRPRLVERKAEKGTNRDECLPVQSLVALLRLSEKVLQHPELLVKSVVDVKAGK